MRTTVRKVHVPASVLVLREHGPLTLDQITPLTAERLGADQYYLAVDSVLSVAEQDGLVRRVEDPTLTDYRRQVWEALPAAAPVNDEGAPDGR